MEKIKEMVKEVVKECQSKGIPFLAAFGSDNISIREYAPEHTPARLRKAKTTLISTTEQEVREYEIQA